MGHCGGVFRPFAALVALSLVSAAACGESPGYDRVRQASQAPELIETHRDAVVRIRHGHASGTGFFVGPSRLLVTNAHVLGPGSCALKGCWIDLELYLASDRESITHTIFVEPVGVDVANDLAVWRPAGLSKSDFDVVTSIDAINIGPDLNVGAAIHVLGHPYAGLKKWSPGSVVDTDQRWLRGDALVVSGNSGSPVFDEGGQLVGVVARAGFSPTRESSDASVLIVPAQYLEPLFEEDAEFDTLPDMDLVTTLDEVLANEGQLFNARRSTVNLDVDGVFEVTKVTDALAAVCDRELQMPDPVDADTVSKIFEACVVGVRWLNCGAPFEVHQTCPSSTVRQAWSNRVVQAGAKINNLEPDLRSSIARTLARLKSGLQPAEFLDYYAPVNLQVQAPYTAQDAVDAIAWHIKENLPAPQWAVDAVRDYEGTPAYWRDARMILTGLVLLSYTSQGFSQERVKGIAARLLRDKALLMRAYIGLEYDMYRFGWHDELE